MASTVRKQSKMSVRAYLTFFFKSGPGSQAWESVALIKGRLFHLDSRNLDIPPQTSQQVCSLVILFPFKLTVNSGHNNDNNKGKDNDAARPHISAEETETIKLGQVQDFVDLTL